MAIDFNKQLVFDPKIDIVGNEVPLAAMEKTGTVLQDRYDKSYENETKTQALMKKALQDVAEEDKPAAQAAFDLYQQRLADRAKSGDYHNMRWQTLQDAQEFGNIYTGLANKAQIIAKEKERIATSKDYLTDKSRAAALKQFQKQLGSAKFDTENRVLSGLTVNPFKEAADTEDLKLALTYGAMMKPIVDKNTGAQMVPVDAYGKEVSDPNQAAMLMVKTKTGNLVELKPEQIQTALAPAMRTDINVQAKLDRDVTRAGLDINTPEGQAYKEQLFNEEVLPAIGAASGILRQKQDMRSENINFHNVPQASSDGDGSGRKKKSLDDLLVTNTETSGTSPYTNLSKGKAMTNAPQELVLRGIVGWEGGFGSGVNTPEEEKMWYNELNDALDYNIENAANDKQASRFTEAKKMFKDFKQLSKDFPEYKRTLQEVITREPGYAMQNVFDKALSVGETIKQGLSGNDEKSKEFAKKYNELNTKYRNFIGQWGKDSDIEQGIENYLKKPKEAISNSIPMLAPSIKDEALQKAFNYMGNVFNHTNTEVYKKSDGFDMQKPFEFRKVATAPRGNGTGILFEVQQKDKDGKTQTALVEPNYEGRYDILENVENAIYESTGKPIDLVNANKFKNVSPFRRVGQIKTIQDIFEEAGIGKVRPDIADVKIKKVNNGYTIPGLKAIKNVNGKPVQTKEDEIFSSYIEAIHALNQ